MTKIFKKILTVALAVVCTLSLVACVEAEKTEGEKGLFVKKIGGVYTIYKYVDDVDTNGNLITTLDIGAELAELEITEEVRIQSQAFNGNTGLTEIIVSGPVNKIEKGAFAGMKALKSLTVPFVGLTANADSFINETTESVDKAVDSERTIAHFFGDSEYTEGISQTITWGTGENQTATCYMPLSFNKLVVTGNKIPASAFNGLTKLIDITFTGAVEVVGDYAFANTNQLKKVNLPNSIKTIGKNAFENSSIEEMTMPTELVTIDNYAFKACKNLKKVVLNAKLEKINYQAFYNCGELTTVYTDGITSLKLANLAFDDCAKLNYFGAKANETSKKIYLLGNTEKDLTTRFVFDNEIVYTYE